MSLSLKKHPMPEQDPAVRAKNFEEVTLGYDDATAKAEAERCLQCKAAPCRNGCPVSVDIPGFIRLIKEGDMPGAAANLQAINSLPAVCGRVCPQEEQCEKQCVLAKRGEAVGIGRLERYVADYARQHEFCITTTVAPRGAQKVAVIGSGPAGLRQPAF